MAIVIQERLNLLSTKIRSGFSRRIQIVRTISQLISFFLINGAIFGLAHIPAPVPVQIPAGSPFATVLGGFSMLQYVLSQGQVPFFVIGMFFLTGALFGRLFCGWACPVGFWQDMLSWIPIRKFRVNRGDNGSFKGLAWLIIAVSLFIALLTGVTRLASTNISVDQFNQMPFDAFDPAGVLFVTWFYLLSWDVIKLDASFFTSLGQIDFIVLIKIAVFMVVTFVSIKIPRAYCRYICPTGAILGVCTKYSMLTISTDVKKNKDAPRLASKACPMDINSDAFTKEGVMDSHCIMCANCIDAVPDALSYKLRFRT